MTTEFKKRLISSIFLIPICILLIFEGSILFNFFLFTCFVISFYEWSKMINKIQVSVAGYFFLIFSFLSAYLIRNTSVEGDDGLFYFLLTILICIGTDIGGYVFGKLLKGPKLISISPNKTYAGMVGSFVTSLIVCKIYFYFTDFFFSIKILLSVKILSLILLISFVSQCGDIIISYFKRSAKIKNTGNFIPGHGGILDRIDGMIFAFPLSLIIYSKNLFQ